MRPILTSLLLPLAASFTFIYQRIPIRTMSQEHTDLTKTERRLSSLLMSSGQPQEGSLKNSIEADGYRDVRDVFSDCAPDQSELAMERNERVFESPSEFRSAVRAGKFKTSTNGVCPGYMQANLVVLEEKYAFDFLLFCQKNKKACPLVEVLDIGCVEAQCGKGSDLRVDIPKYCIYKNGKLEREVTDATPYWPDNAVAFLIGCSFSYDGALLAANIPLRSVEQNKNVPMYRTNVATTPAGIFHGNVVVSMKPIKSTDVAKEVLITSQYPHAHGPPLCVGNPQSIGIDDVNNPHWGDAVEILDDEVPVFHYCGVTPQQVLIESGLDFFISHAPGHMFVTDLASDAVI